ncbi:MAG: beta-galactosidase [Ruminococcus sp.]|nr:beta-galactosidase [Ruminococcus sp.]
MKIGVDYYPEQWDTSFWEKDAEMMMQAGVKIVRIGDASWSITEPKEGEYDFRNFDDIMRIFKRHNIEVVIGIPSNCPPMWMYKSHPEIIRTDCNGRRIKTEQKNQMCINSPVYIDYVKKLTERMARRYGSDTNVLGWQITDGTELKPCGCDVCKEKFRAWLLDKYDTLENINIALGSWYSDISYIQPPLESYELRQNPSLSIEYSRFCSESMFKFVKEIMTIIKREAPRAKVTANVRHSDCNSHLYKLFDGLDFVSCSSYPLHNNSDTSRYDSFFLDLMRGINGRSFWVMEQHSDSEGDSLPMIPASKPGQLSGYAFQAIAHGADNILFYRWRSAVAGSDMFRCGLIDHSGIPGRRYYEFSEFCKTVSGVGVLDTTELVSDIAILYNPENEWAFRVEPQTEGFDYEEQLKKFHTAFSGYGANVDIVSPSADLSAYKAVIAPAMYIHKKSAAENIYRYVINGGTLVLTSRSGVKDANNNCFMDMLPTAYKELIGAEVTECDPIGNSKQTIIDFAGNQFVCHQWCDVLRLTTAKAYAEYNDSYYKCSPAVTMNRYCSGIAYYVGTVCNADFYKSLAGNIMRQTGIPRLKGLPAGVEVTTRTNGLNDFICFFNNSADEATISLPKSMYSIIESIGKDQIVLKPYGFDIVRK